jgi:ADP-dependent phosphofructokinase/glucokinase
MKLLCGYNVNIDALCKVIPSRISSLFSKTDARMGGLGRHQRQSIETINDFFSGLLHCMEGGVGGEMLISDKKIFDFLKKEFLRNSSLRMGGNAGNMCNALSELGAEFVFVNAPSLPELQAKLFSAGGARVPVLRNKKVVFLHPAKAVRKGDEELIHFIFEFQRGTSISIGKKKIVVPRENRFIATWDDANTTVRLAQHFRDASMKIIRDIDGAILTGFHLMSENVFKDSESVQLAKTWREENEDLPFHYELGHFQNRDVMREVLRELSFDSMGMNEDELANCMSLLGHKNLEKKIMASKSSVDVLEGAEVMIRKFALARICIHTREFSITLLRNGGAEEETKALNFGSERAAAFASFEDVGTECKDSSQSITGVREIENLKKKIEWDERGFGHRKDLAVCIVPSRICSKPKRTVGMGDVFTAATFFSMRENATRT